MNYTFRLLIKKYLFVSRIFFQLDELFKESTFYSEIIVFYQTHLSTSLIEQGVNVIVILCAQHNFVAAKSIKLIELLFVRKSSIS
jgi:hypothetical protein